MNEELLKEIKGMLPWLVVAGLAVGGYYGVKHYRETKAANASLSLMNSTTVGDFEAAVSQYGTSDAGGALKLKLAKKYYDEERYDEALGQYEALAKESPEGYAGIAEVGRAFCLEGKKMYAEAKAAFEAFAAANEGHFLQLVAKIGAIRTTALAGDREGAAKAAAALKESVKGDATARVLVEQLEGLVKAAGK